MKVYEIDSNFVGQVGNQWLSGKYDSADTLAYAKTNFTTTELDSIWIRCISDGNKVITLAYLNSVKVEIA